MTKKKWKREDITPEVLRELLHLDEETGKLYWKERDEKWFSDGKNSNGGVRPASSFARTWNNTNSGNEAGTSLWGTATKSYRIGVLGIEFNKAIIVYAIYNGIMPRGVVSPVDRDPLNLRPSNLVDISRSEMSYRFANDFSIGETGFRGVSVSKSLMDRGHKKIYQAQMCGPVGVFESPIEAARAYDAAAFEKYGKHARLNFPEDYGLEVEFEEAPEGYDPTIISA